MESVERDRIGRMERESKTARELLYTIKAKNTTVKRAQFNPSLRVL